MWLFVYKILFEACASCRMFLLTVMDIVLLMAISLHQNSTWTKYISVQKALYVSLFYKFKNNLSNNSTYLPKNTYIAFNNATEGEFLTRPQMRLIDILHAYNSQAI